MGWGWVRLTGFVSKRRFQPLTDAQWTLIEPLLPVPKRRQDRRGRPGHRTETAWKAFSGCFGPGPPGGSLPTNIPFPRLAGGV